MADGEKKDMTITKVAKEPPFHATDKKKKHYRVDSDIGVVSLVLPDSDPPPKVGDSLMGMLYPNTNPQYPPKFYPNTGGKGGGGGRGKSPEEIRSIAAQTALIRATELAAAGKIEVAAIGEKTREFYGVLKELAA